MLEVHTHTDGGQTAESVAERVVTWIAGARETLDLALYDVRLPGDVGDRVADGIRAAAARGADPDRDGNSRRTLRCSASG
jgi:hypothetical protein